MDLSDSSDDSEFATLAPRPSRFSKIALPDDSSDDEPQFIAKKKKKPVVATLEDVSKKAKAAKPKDIEDSDLETSVSSRPVDPFTAILNFLGPEQRALLESMQRDKAELEGKVSELNSALDERQRELEAKDKELESHKRNLDAKEKELELARKQPKVESEAAASAPPPPPVHEHQLNDDFEEESNELEVYAEYQPLILGGSPHPTALCSSTNLADLLEPEIKNTLQSHLHDRSIANTALSDAQLEAIALARRRNVVDRLGFAVGDATGVGKSRIALGYIFNHFAFISTSKKPNVLYISVSNLFNDVSADAACVGLPSKFVNGVKFSNKGTSEISCVSNLLFVSHTVLAAFGAVRLLKWLLGKKTVGEVPILIVDEVHKLANKNTKCGTTAATLLDQAHAAGVHILVLSATFASNVPQLQLTAKITGLIRSDVHPEHPVAAFKNLATTMRRLGEVGLEALTMQLRTSGGYVSRSLSMAGVEFELVEANMSAVELERYARAATLWKDLMAIPELWVSNKLVSVYHSAALRFFKGLTMLIRLPAVIATARQALERGESVILTCLSTDEASIARSVAEAEDDEVDDNAIDAAETESRLKNGSLLDNILQVITFAKKHTSNSSTSDALDRIAARAKAMDLPVVGALDVAKHRLAAALDNDRSKVVELTGRQKMLKCDFDDDCNEKENWKIVTRNESLLAGKQRFQEGKARVALLSAAASTGCSLHDLTGARRNMIAMELPYSSIQFVQTAGRAHRAGQRSPPKIVLVTLPAVDAESRFAASICARLAQLGAISTGDRRSGAGVVDFGEATALTGALANTAAYVAATEYSISLGNTPTSIKLMNRCLARAPSDGNAVMARFRAELTALQSSSRNKSSRVVDIVADGIHIKETGSFARRLPPGVSGRSLVKTFRVDRGLEYDAALAKCVDEGPHRRVAMYKKKNRDRGPPTSPIVLADIRRKGEEDYTAKLVRPNGNKTTLQGDVFEGAYAKVTDETEALALWNQWLARGTEDGSRFRWFSVLTLPVIDFISSNYISTVRLLRVTSDTEAILGMRLEEWNLKSLQADRLEPSEAGPSEAGPSEA